MKTRYSLPSLLLFALVLTGCKDSQHGDPLPETATFRVDLQQTGGYEKFTKIVRISGGDFEDTDTGEPMPTVLYNEDLEGGSYSYEAEGVGELDISTTVGFSPVADAPAAMAMKITVSRNGEVIDESTYLYDQDSDAVNKELSYKAN
ncbi:beta-barrel fold lipoprotein [Pontibacter akesuensis]|uniref:Uncharacterized protein n=1 Tax=Pontibacter akesuensis TaxID=388950 RepID=A0A1I7KP00_9BACT|nr:hypothetical protein [Pontibacter akesuensis]GHA81815.1 hypothetical protein GCM10007389_40550 [Pontibacter akesuensis]SFU99165.1 hypothetical protein SAMN04487941_3926 [Pontibacter akesuensis]